MAVAQECKNQFDEIKKGKKHRYVIFYIEDEKMIKVEAVGDRDASYDSFFMDLTKVNNIILLPKLFWSTVRKKLF